MFKKLALGVGAAACVSMLAAPVAMANTLGVGPAPAKQSLVALGDSITYGYNLNTNVLGDINNAHTSKEAFPYLMGSYENMSVKDLGVPGWTSQQLLAALQSNQEYIQAVRHANVVTIDIGSNDLLHVLNTLPAPAPGESQQDYIAQLEATLGAAAQQAAVTLDTSTLPQILQAVRALNPSARIVVYNLYNPFPATGEGPLVSALSSFADYVLPLVNAGIYADATAAGPGVYYADAFTVFEGNQAQYVRPADVHPTALGQTILAQAGENALALTPP